MNSAQPVSRQRVTADLIRLGIAPGDTVMVHASLKAIGPVQGGPLTIVHALTDAISASGTVMAYVSWAHSPYDATLNGRQLSAETAANWPEFKPDSPPYPGFGALNASIVSHPDCVRSPHPDASMAAIGPAANWLMTPHDPGTGYGPGSPLERFLAIGGKVLLLGAPLDALTVLHYAEAVADLPGKRWVEYRLPIDSDNSGRKWVAVREPDSNGILACYAESGKPDAVETIARAYVRARGVTGRKIAAANCLLIDAGDLVQFGRDWLERKHSPRNLA